MINIVLLLVRNGSQFDLVHYYHYGRLKGDMCVFMKTGDNKVTRHKTTLPVEINS